MFKPRIPKTDKIDKDDVREKLSALKSELSTLGTSEVAEDTFSFDDVIEILKKENADLSKLLHYEQDIRKVKLEEEKSVLLRYKEEEENLISSCNDYVKNESFMKGEAIDNAQEMLLRLEVLHKKLCTLLKKFAHDNFPVAEEPARCTRSGTRSSQTNKSVLHILKLLLPELKSADGYDREPQILKIDETMPDEIIQFLLSAAIIEKCPDDPNFIMLVE